MDKEILRIVIIATGLVVTMGMIFWSYLKGKKAERERNFYDDNAHLIGESLTNNPAAQSVVDIDDFDIIPLGAAKSFDKSDNYFESDDFDDDDVDVNHAPRLVSPSLIQFSLVANADDGFNGTELFNAFEKVGLEYGSMKIFERVDANRLVDFGVACMVEPGTFPETNLETFYCPGLVFFMQPGELENAQAVFDDFVETIKLLASDLDGVIWDHQRQPLTDETVQLIRQSL
jgi:cell division protein ZipA